MSNLLDKDTNQIRALGSALSIPQTFRDPFSFSLNAGGGAGVSVSPTSASTGSVSVTDSGRFNGVFDRVDAENAAASGRLGSLISSLKSNQNPYIQARVNPLQDTVARRVADVSRDLAQRGVQGSIRNNEVNNAAFLGERELGDARALATNEALSAQLEAEATRLGVGSEGLQLAQTQLDADLRRIFAGLEALRTSLGNQDQTTTQVGGNILGSETTGLEDVGSIIDILSQLSIF